MNNTHKAFFDQIAVFVFHSKDYQQVKVFGCLSTPVPLRNRSLPG